MNIGGAGRCILNFLAHYDREAFRVDVALPRGSLLIPEVEKLDTQVFEVDVRGDKSFDRADINKFKAVIRESGAQVVHAHGAMSARVAARRCKRAVVFTRHSVFPVGGAMAIPPVRWLNGMINEYYADAIIAVAEAAKENLVDSGVHPQKIEVVLNGVDGQTRLPPEAIAEERAKYGIPDGHFVAGILARLEAVKGHGYLIEAARLLKDRGREITVLIAGAGQMEETLRAQVGALGLEDTVLFAGFVEDVPRLLSVLDLQVNASFGTEATSLALLEGMSMGLPAVVTDYGGNPGVIQDGVNGRLVPTRNSVALAAAIEEMMTDRVAYEQMVAGSLDVFAEKFTAEIYARNIERIYRRAAMLRYGKEMESKI